MTPPLTTFRLRCPTPTCDLYHTPMMIPSYGEADALKKAHDWVWDGTDGFKDHAAAIIDEVTA